MFKDDELYDKALLAKKVHRTTRSIANWRKSGLLPEPDILVAGRYPAWWGRTLNAAQAFAPAAAADAA